MQPSVTFMAFQAMTQMLSPRNRPKPPTIASSSPENEMTGATGPNTSSFRIRALAGTSANTVAG